MATALAMPITNPTPQKRPRLPIATASGLLALLSEPDPTLVQHALTKLLSVVDTLWHEVAEALPDLEAIAEGGALGEEEEDNDDTNMAVDNAAVVFDTLTRQKAAALASRVFFHLEEPRQALRLALESGNEYFNVLSPKVEDEAYVERLVNAAIGEYVKKRRGEFDGAATSGGGGAVKEEEEEEELDMDKLQSVVHLMFERCYQDGHYGHALGVAFESMEKEKVAEILDRLLTSSSTSGSEEKVVSTLKYALQSAQTLITSKNFRVEALTLVASTLEQLVHSKNGDYSLSNTKEAACTLVLCRQILGEAEAVGKIITSLIDATAKATDEEGEDTALLGLQLCFDIVDSGDEAFVTKVAQFLPKQVEGGETDANDTRSDITWAYFSNAHRVLTGGFTSELSLSFLYKNSNLDGKTYYNMTIN